ncbi:hypothetical protein Q4488_06750, partial [Amphritea sp. 1_MG-2023]|uniref:type IV pilus modification PilV family protein n=1 Tax=Amphritea sp. 1_MG-2023 TaxID=3062670 RepID=UPI0026E3C763
MNKMRNTHPQQGIAMLELVIAVLILAFGVISLGAMQNQTMGNSNYSKAMAEASVIAEKKLEELRHFPTLSDYDSTIATASSAVTGTNAEYSTAWVVTNHTAPDYKTVTMTVSWEDRYGPQSVQLSSLIAQDEPVEGGKLLYTLSGGSPSSSNTPDEDTDDSGSDDSGNDDSGNDDSGNDDSGNDDSGNDDSGNDDS